MKTIKAFLGSILVLLVVSSSYNCSGGNNDKRVENKSSKDSTMKRNKLTAEEAEVIINKGTERPFKGEYTDNVAKGTYTCKQCDAPLYKSDSKFHSGCGWPSFDEEIKGAVKKTLDSDGRRTEITCANCDGHLGHVFYGEGLTDKDTRHCVNSISMNFIPDNQTTSKMEKAIFAGGCFWGVEYYFQNAKGVISTQVGYTGGRTKNPTYKEVCAHGSGHIEAIEVTYDPTITTYEDMAKLFFEIHDPTQTNGQGNDIGEQYLSIVFYANDSQKKIAQKLIDILTNKGMKIATQLREATIFYSAEEYHQQYYQKDGGTPYCHKLTKRF